MTAPNCSECGRTLCISDSRLMCVWRHCPEYARPVNDDSDRTLPCLTGSQTVTGGFTALSDGT